MLKAAVALACLTAWAQPAPAQPDTFGGDPDSSRFIRVPKDTDDWTRHFRIGAVVGMNISADFNQSGLFALPGNNAASGIYDDGYVRVDQLGDPDYTSYWGYENRAQYNDGSQTLQMHSATAYSASGASSTDGGAFPGFEMAYGGNLWYWKHARVGWELGFGLLPINISESSTTPATVTQNTYTFHPGATLGGVGFPAATTYQGGSSGVGPIISTAYDLTTTTNTGSLSGSQTLDVMLYTLRLGPTIYWDVTEHVAMSFGAGPAVGLVSGDYKYDQTIAVGTASSHNSGQISGSEFVYGGYVNGTLMYHVQANGDADIFVSAQFMPMTDATISGGGREGRLNLGGQLYLSVGINWPF